MKIKDIQPLQERVYTIELSELEMKALVCCMGSDNTIAIINRLPSSYRFMKSGLAPRTVTDLHYEMFEVLDDAIKN